MTAPESAAVREDLKRRAERSVIDLVKRVASYDCACHAGGKPEAKRVCASCEAGIVWTRIVEHRLLGYEPGKVEVVE